MEKLVFMNNRGQSIELKNSGPFLLTKIEGTGSPKTTLLTSKAPNQDGKSYHGSLLEERILPIEGAIIGDSIEDVYRKRKELCSIFNPKIPGTLTYINNYGQYRVDCVIEDSPVFKEKTANIQDFLIQVYCPNPYWLDTIEYKEEIASWIGDFEFSLEILEAGIEVGHRESNLIVNVNNEGDVECGMRIEFKALATVVNPSLLNIYTQEYLKIKRTLQVGDKLVISTHFSNKKVELVRSGVVTNVFNYIDLNSTFLQLDIGDNLFRYDAENGIDNLEVSIYYRPQYIGV